MFQTISRAWRRWGHFEKIWRHFSEKQYVKGTFYRKYRSLPTPLKARVTGYRMPGWILISSYYSSSAVLGRTLSTRILSPRKFSQRFEPRHTEGNRKCPKKNASVTVIKDPEFCQPVSFTGWNYPLHTDLINFPLLFCRYRRLDTIMWFVCSSMDFPTSYHFFVETLKLCGAFTKHPTFNC